jgi:hypothetical protein
MRTKTVSPANFVASSPLCRLPNRLHASACDITLTPAQREELEKAARRFEDEAARVGK